MKTVLIVFLSLSSWFATCPRGVAGDPASLDSQVTASGPMHEEIAHLRREFDRRRADALRPVTEEYIAQLEALQRSVRERERGGDSELAAAVKAARESYWQDDQPELRQALLARTWLWRSNDDDHGVTTTFREDGTVEHIGLHGTWRITGPNEITIVASGDGLYLLRFNASLRRFEGDRGGVTGSVIPSPVEMLCSHIWSLRDDTLEFLRNGRLIQRGAGWEGKDWHLSEDGKKVTITFTNGNGGTFQFENGTMTHFDGSPFRSTPRR